jgi:4-alpha-glucanotransferase
LRHAGGLRIDHVMGLFRLFWIPKNSGAREGAYVRHPTDKLLAILALESERAKAYIVGADLGTIDKKFRQHLVDSCVLSYRLVWFENDPPAVFPEQALAAVTTHDLPTIAGLWTGSDLKAQRELGSGAQRTRNESDPRLAIPVCWGFRGKLPSRKYQTNIRAATPAPSKIVSATLDDALAVEERPNMPGVQLNAAKLVCRFTKISGSAGAARIDARGRADAQTM